MLIYILDLNSIQISFVKKVSFISLKKVLHLQRDKNSLKGKRNFFNYLCSMVENMTLVNILTYQQFRDNHKEENLFLHPKPKSGNKSRFVWLITR